MKTLYFIRHGEAEHNLRNTFGGNSDTQLTTKGIEQARYAGQNAKHQKLSFDIIISSPLTRAHHTAKIVARHLDYPREKILIEDVFRERNFGTLEGKDFKTYQHDYLEGEAGIDHHDGVERFIDLQWRAQKAFEWLQSLPYDSILVVGHGAFGRALRRAAQGRPITEEYDHIPNAEIIKFL